MKVSSKLAPIYQKYESYIAELMEETHVDVLFGIILTDMGEYSKASAYLRPPANKDVERSSESRQYLLQYGASLPFSR